MELEQWFSTNSWGEKFIYIRQTRIPFFNVILCGLTQPNPEYDVDFPEGCPCYILDFILSGKGTLTVDDTVYSFQPGDLLFIRKGTPVRMRSDSADPCRKLFIQMSGTVLKTFCTLFQLSEGVSIHPCPVEMQMWEIANILRNTTLANVQESMCQISVKIFEILSLYQQETTFGKIKENDSLPFQIRRILDEHVYRDISVQDIAGRLHLTDSHCIRTFRKQFEISPMQYLNRLRMEQACILLKETSIPVREIAQKLCFYNSQHFSTAFRKYMKLSPSEYRHSCFS